MRVRLDGGPIRELSPTPLYTGGEGDIFSIVGDRLLVKVFHQPTRNKEEKLRAMLASPPSIMRRVSLDTSVSWPVHIANDADSGSFLGYALPPIPGVSIHTYLHAKFRPQAVDGRVIIATARRIAKFVRDVHKDQIIIGDINSANILVQPKRIGWIDTDSFQITRASQTFRCEVAAPDYAAPEILNRPRDSRDATLHEDFYSLAVLLFHFFLEGSHPFRAKVLGSQNSTQIERVREGKWAYTPNSFGLAPPADAPEFHKLPADIRLLFEACFTRGMKDPLARPSAADWVDALDRVEQSGEFERIWKNRHRATVATNTSPRSSRLNRWLKVDRKNLVIAASLAVLGLVLLTVSTSRSTQSSSAKSIVRPASLSSVSSGGRPTPAFWRNHRSVLSKSN